MEHGLQLQTLFPFEIRIQALIQFLVLFDIQPCFILRAYSFCFCKSSEINRFAGLYFLYSYLSSSNQNLLCYFRAAAAKNEVLSSFIPKKMAFMKKGPFESQLRIKKKPILSNLRIKSIRDMDGCEYFCPQFFYSCGLTPQLCRYRYVRIL